MSAKITQFIGRNFDKKIVDNLGLFGRQKIKVIFKIDKNGDVIDIRARAPHPKLEWEAIRVIGMLPKMKPGLKLGKPVNVQYALPITFNVQKSQLPKRR
jgi:protein TonB